MRRRKETKQNPVVRSQMYRQISLLALDRELPVFIFRIHPERYPRIPRSTRVQSVSCFFSSSYRSVQETDLSPDKTSIETKTNLSIRRCRGEEQKRDTHKTFSKRIQRRRNQKSFLSYGRHLSKDRKEKGSPESNLQTYREKKRSLSSRHPEKNLIYMHAVGV